MTSQKPRNRPTEQRGAIKTKVYGRYQREIDACAKAVIEKALRETAGNVQATAKVLGITAAALWRRMKALGINADTYRSR